MDLEHLTTSQVILLVLLVSFVTSIATGIVTVSLLAQTPPAITQTINRVMERTIETVVPSENQTASVVTKETTVVVKEDDLITDSIGKGFARLVRIHEGVATSTPIIALGVVTGSGTIVTDSGMVSREHAVVLGGEVFRYTVSGRIPEVGIAFMSATGTPPSVSALKGADVGSLKLGQMVIGLLGARSDRVLSGVVGSVYSFTSVNLPNGESASFRFIDASGFGAVTAGTPLITIFGDLVGISTHISRAEGGANSFVAFSDVTSFISLSQTATTSESTAR